MNILFYTPVNFRCRDIESLAKEYTIRGHNVFLLSQCIEGPLHTSFRENGMKAVSGFMPYKGSFSNVVSQWKYLVGFCRKNKIQIVYSHLEPTNFISVLAQYFILAKVIIYRHHINAARLSNFDRSITYRLTYFLAKTIICVSRQGKEYMINEEKISKNKIIHINLGYDFSLYETPEPLVVKEIRSGSNSDILLISVGRLIKSKRPDVAVELVRQANLRGINASILFLGVGEAQEEIHQLAREYNIESKVIFVGYSQQILSYLAAADILIHPSISESSCVVIKEAGLVELPVIVCKGVGDFDDYMENEVNGAVVDRELFVEESLVHLERYLIDRKHYKAMGKKLKENILSRFSIEKVFNEYSKFTVNN